MRANELRELPPEELEIKLSEAKEEFFNLRFQNATGQLENYKQLYQVRKDIARIQTVIKELELGIEIEHKELLPPKPRKEKVKAEEAEAPELELEDDDETDGATPAPEEVEARLAATEDEQEEGEK